MELLPEGISLYAPENAPSCRYACEPDDPQTAFVLTLDGFLASANIEVLSCETVDEQFAHSDHNPVLLRFRLLAEAKENHGLRYARMLGIANMREQCFLTAAVQNIKRLVASLRRVYLYIIPCIFTQMQGFVNGLAADGYSISGCKLLFV